MSNVTSDPVLTALMTALFTLLGVLLTQYFVLRSITETGRRLYIELNRKTTEKLIDLRIEYYPEALLITENLRGQNIFHSGLNLTKQDLENCANALHKWCQGKPMLIMSPTTTAKYYQLYRLIRNVTSELGEPQDKHPNLIQLEPIRKVNSEFRHELLKDVGLLHLAALQEGGMN